MNPTHDPLEKLLDAYFEGSMDSSARDDLSDMLTSSADARGRFWQRASIEGAMETWAEKRRGKSIGIPMPSPMLRPAWKRRMPTLSGWAAAALLTIGWTLHYRTVKSDFAPTAGAERGTRPVIPATPVKEDTPVAYLSRSSDLDADCRLLSGQALAAGREVVIRRGMLEIDFYSGARVSIQGPARFLPESDMRLRVNEGFVQVEVPESAKGFTLGLPDGTVTDFGTSFEVEVKNEKTSRLQVTKGEVEFAGAKNGAPAKRLIQGQALALADDGAAESIRFSPAGLKNSLNESSTRDGKLRAAKWDQACKELADDPSVLVHFRFLPDETGSREIINRAANPNSPRTGTVVAAEWSRGRWEGKSALAFHGPSDRVRVDIPGEYPLVTYVVWVKTDALPRRYNGLFLSESGIAGEAHWQFSTDGRFMFGVRPRNLTTEGQFHRAFSEPVMFPSDFGTWHMLATTYDATRREVAHYFDGREVHRSSVKDSIPIRFGRATLGNFFDPDPAAHAGNPGLGETWSFRNWSGAIDEFVLFSRVLGQDEISALLEAGLPN